MSKSKIVYHSDSVMCELEMSVKIMNMLTIALLTCHQIVMDTLASLMSCGVPPIPPSPHNTSSSSTSGIMKATEIH